MEGKAKAEAGAKREAEVKTDGKALVEGKAEAGAKGEAEAKTDGNALAEGKAEAKVKAERKRRSETISIPGSESKLGKKR